MYDRIACCKPTPPTDTVNLASRALTILTHRFVLDVDSRLGKQSVKQYSTLAQNNLFVELVSKFFFMSQ